VEDACATGQLHERLRARHEPRQADGTLVSNVAGYKLYYGLQSGHYQTVVAVGLTTTYTVKNLSAGQTFYFAVKAYDSTGTESAFSNEISVILPTNTPEEGIIPQQQMRVVFVDSQEQVGENGAATNASRPSSGPCACITMCRRSPWSMAKHGTKALPAVRRQ
jgi:hypothetical protein